MTLLARPKYFVIIQNTHVGTSIAFECQNPSDIVSVTKGISC